MSKFLHKLCFIYMALLLPLSLFTQCQVSNQIAEPDLDSDTIQIVETRQMYYDNYICLKDRRYSGDDYEPKEVTISRCGKEFSIKGIFKKYPDVWIKGTIMAETPPDLWQPYLTRKVYFENGQIIAHENGKPVYFHCGKADYSSIHKPESVTQQFTFEPEDNIMIFRFGDNPDYVGTFYEWYNNQNAFWYDNDPNGATVFYSTWQDRTVRGTGFPDFDCVVNFRIDNTHESEIDSNSETK